MSSIRMRPRSIIEDDLEVILSGQPKLGIVEPYRTGSGERTWVQTDKVPYTDTQKVTFLESWCSRKTLRSVDGQMRPYMNARNVYGSSWTLR